MTNETYVDATLSKSKLFNFVAIFEVLHTYLESFYISSIYRAQGIPKIDILSDVY